MSDSGIGDLSKIVSLIMENPKLIEEISNLAKGSEINDAHNEEITKTEDIAEASTPESTITPKILGITSIEAQIKALVGFSKLGLILLVNTPAIHIKNSIINTLAEAIIPERTTVCSFLAIK